MVFLIQCSQNRDSCAIHLKLDEIISSLKNAKDELMDLEGLDQKNLDRIRDEYSRRAELARKGQSVKDKPQDDDA
jgi:low affinity Fe/Cu permease